MAWYEAIAHFTETTTSDESWAVTWERRRSQYVYTIKIWGWFNPQKMTSQLQSAGFIQVQVVAASFCQGLGLHPLSSQNF